MNIEIKNFYFVELRDKTLRGTLHVVIKLSEFEINLRGILVSRSGQTKKYFFQFPMKNAMDSKTKTTVNYPIFLFRDASLNKKLFDEIYRLAPDFIEAWLKENPQPAIESKIAPIQKASGASRSIEQAEPRIKAVERNGSDPMQKKPPSDIKKIASIQWNDVPPLKKPSSAKPTMAKAGNYGRK